MTERRRLTELSDEELEAERARVETEKTRVEAELAKRRAATAPKTMDDIENEGEAAGRKLGEEILTRRLAELPPENNDPKPCPRCGKAVSVRSKARARTLRTLIGKATYRRNYHYCESCQEGFYPRDIELGLPREGLLSSSLERRVLDFAVNDTFEQAAERWSVHYPERPISANLLRRVVDRVGRRCEQADAVKLQVELKAPQKPPDLLVVQTDGSQLPMRGEEQWKEAKVAVLFRGDAHVRGTGSERGTLASPRYVAVLGGQDAFATELVGALAAERRKRAGDVIWMGDGAPANWRLAQQLSPGCTEILDWYHAVEHAMTCGKTLLGDTSELLPLWQRRSETLLANGDTGTLIAELLDCVLQADDSGLGAIDDLIRYYRGNERRMKYAAYRAQKLPIGSGVVESAHKHVLQVRMKRAGQRWSPMRARRMVKLRAAYRTAGAEHFHAAIDRAHRRTMGTPAKVTARRRLASNR
jgi:hypothetical protein